MVSSFPPVTGVSEYAHILAESLRETGRVECISYRHIYPSFLYPGKTLWHGNKRLPSVRYAIDWYNPLTWIRAGMSAQGDAVHLQWWSWPLVLQVLSVATLARLRGKRVVTTIHNPDFHESSAIAELAQKAVIRASDSIIVHSARAAALVREKYAAVIPINVIPIPSSSVPASGRRRRGKAGLRLLFFGNIREYKGVDVLIKAFRRTPGDMRLVVAGKCWEDPGKYVRLSAGDERITLRLGYLPEEQMADLFREADLVVLPYVKFSSSSAAGALAMGYGTPVLVSDQGDLRDLVQDSRAVVRPTVASLAAKLRFLQEHPETIKRWRKEMHEQRRQFDPKIVAARTWEAYYGG